MGLVDFVAFLFLKILYNLVSMKYFLNVNNCWHKQSFEKRPQWTFLFFDVLSESRIGFVPLLAFWALGSVVSFTKTRFYQKRSSVTMRNYVETFHANIGHNLA